MRILTWNINSVRLRIGLLAALAEESDADIICLQETKVADELFPHDAIEEMGYIHQAAHGMKSYNGVAILSRLPFKEATTKDWCQRQDCRHIYVTLEDGTELHNFYIPAGGDEPDPELNEKFAHKLAFLRAMARWWRGRREPDVCRIMVGDFNVAPLETDVWSHKQLLNVVSHTPLEVDLLNAMQQSGPWTDAVREIIPPEENLYSWWSYRNREWPGSDRGRRLDHVWITEALGPALINAEILRHWRGKESPSDHAPVMVELEI
ncbi:MAG: exodeoxyribonuclease III [Pseudomonadota bacterium]|nr:exodeoxyribonuclease III [Pseudomonadota bacterium]